MKFVSCIVIVAIAVAGLLAQTVPQFDVASVRLRAPDSRPVVNGGPGTSDPGHITYRAINLQRLVMLAYGLEAYQVKGPDWLAGSAPSYDVMATMPPGTSKEQLALMLRGLITERFKLVMHREPREMSVYDLVVAKTGAKLTKVAVAGPDLANPDPAAVAGRTQPGSMVVTGMEDGAHLLGRRIPMPTIASYLSRLTGIPVIDQTGLAGYYDINLTFARDSAGGVPSASEPSTNGEPIAAALHGQYGLDLQSRKGPVEMLVIDMAEKTPAEN